MLWSCFETIMNGTDVVLQLQSEVFEDFLTLLYDVAEDISKKLFSMMCLSISEWRVLQNSSQNKIFPKDIS